MNKKYDWLLFDADNTLWNFSKSEVYALEKSFADEKIPYQKSYLKTYHVENKKCWDAFERGDLTQDRLRTLRMEKFFQVLEMDFDPVKFSELYHHNLSITDFMIDGAYELLDRLKGHFKMALVTNGLKEVQRGRIETTKIGDYFETIVISDEIGVSKPHAGFFDYTFEQINHPPKSSALMIGDSLNSDIYGGNSYGLDTCWYNPKRKYYNESTKPTFIINKLEQLLAIIES